MEQADELQREHARSFSFVMGSKQIHESIPRNQDVKVVEVKAVHAIRD